jgi:TolB protein
MRADGSDKREVSRTTTGFDSRPHWSPNGAELAFSRHYGGGETDITIVPATGGASRRLALPGRQSMPAWSPDGTMIAFVQDDPGRQNVYTMSPDGSRVRLRTVDPAWGGGVGPSWIRKP